MNLRLKKAVALFPIVMMTLSLTGCDKAWNMRFQGNVVTAAGDPAPGLSAQLCYKVNEHIHGCTGIKTDQTGAFFLDKSGKSELAQAQINKENFYLKQPNGTVIPASLLTTRSLVNNDDGVKASLLGLFRMVAPPSENPPVVVTPLAPPVAPQPPAPPAPPAPVQETWHAKFNGTVLDPQGAPKPGLTGDLCYRVSQEIKGCQSVTTDADGKFGIDVNGSGAVSTISVQRLNFYVRTADDKILADKIETTSQSHVNGLFDTTLNGVYKMEAPDAPDTTGMLQHNDPNAVVARLDLSGRRLHDRSIATGQQNGDMDSAGDPAAAAHLAGAAI